MSPASGEFGDFGGKHQYSADDGDQRHHQERFGQQAVCPKRHLHRVQQLNDQQDEKDLVEQADYLTLELARHNRENKRLRGDP